MSLPARDLLDVRLSEAYGREGCPICAVRARSERAALDSMVTEGVMDIATRGRLERSEGFCRRHLRELIIAERDGPGSLLGSGILYRTVLGRRLEIVRRGSGAKGRGLRAILGLAAKRPPCIACAQGTSGVEIALGRSVERAQDPAWADAMARAPFCLDDLIDLWRASKDEAALTPILRRQLERLTDLEHRLAGFIDHSSFERRLEMTDRERDSVAEAAAALGGDGD